MRIVILSRQPSLYSTRVLVEAGASLDNPGNLTAVSYAAYVGHVEILRYLLDSKASPDGGAIGEEYRYPTPLGMAAGDPLPIDISRLAAAVFVGDVVTVPEMTPLLMAAREKGCAIQTGVGMFERSVGLMANFFSRPR